MRRQSPEIQEQHWGTGFFCTRRHPIDKLIWIHETIFGKQRLKAFILQDSIPCGLLAACDLWICAETSVSAGENQFSDGLMQCEVYQHESLFQEGQGTQTARIQSLVFPKWGHENVSQLLQTYEVVIFHLLNLTTLYSFLKWNRFTMYKILSDKSFMHPTPPTYLFQENSNPWNFTNMLNTNLLWLLIFNKSYQNFLQFRNNLFWLSKKARWKPSQHVHHNLISKITWHS